MNERERCFSEWIAATQGAIAALNAWLDSLEEWQANRGREYARGDFDAAWSKLAAQGLSDWLSGQPCDLDRLAETVGGVPCICNEPDSPAARCNRHASWCPAHDRGHKSTLSSVLLAHPAPACGGHGEVGEDPDLLEELEAMEQ